MQNPSSDESLEVITTLAPVETRLAENPPSPRPQINAGPGKETLARRRDLTAFIGEYDVPHGHKCIGDSDSYLASQVIVATSGKTECIVVCRPRPMARWHLYGGDDLDALQHCRDQRGRDPIIAEAALASDSQKPRSNQLVQVAARRRARDIGAVSKLSCRQRLAAHKGVKHRRSRSVTHESSHFHQMCRRDHP